MNTIDYFANLVKSFQNLAEFFCYEQFLKGASFTPFLWGKRVHNSMLINLLIRIISVTISVG